MKASELIRLLRDARDSHGDLEVIVRDRSVGDSYTITSVAADPATPMEADGGTLGTIDIIV